MFNKSSKIGFSIFLVIYFLGIFSLGNWVERHLTLPLSIAFTSAFLGYLFLLFQPDRHRILFLVGIIARISLFFSLPILSDDIYRFIWDGTLLKNGIHPFSELPTHYVDQGIEGIDQTLYNKLNSPNYFTIYPPLNQFIFWLSVIIGNEYWLVSANVIKLILFGADIGSFILLKQLLKYHKKLGHLALWYFLNPMVIIEFTGNLHFEGLVVFFTLLGIYYYENNKKILSSIGLGLAVGSKLLPLIYLPYFFLKGIKEKKWIIPILGGGIGLLTIVPMLNQSFISGMQESLELYFRSFEFNASIYFIAREIGYQIYNYNNIALIGPALSVFSFLGILSISILGIKKKWSISKTLLFIMTVYLLFSTTVHPWYILPLIAFGLLSGYWYPIVWSFLIFFTYMGYTPDGFELPLWIIMYEYIIVGLVLWIEITYRTTSTRIFNFQKMKKNFFPFILLISSAFTSCGQKTFDQKMESLYKKSVPLIKSEVLKSKLKNVLLLDTRMKKEYNISHIRGARFVNYDSFKVKHVEDISKDKEVIVYCSVGYRSERIGEKLQKAGYLNVKNLYGGIFAWKNKGYEVVGSNNQPTDSVHTYNKSWSQWLNKGIKIYE